MSLGTDALLDRIRLKAQLLRWRGLSILLAVILVGLFFTDDGNIVTTGNYIARISINGIIENSLDRNDILKELAENNRVKAVIVHINSPGGTVVGGETLYYSLKDISTQKPVIAVMGTLATSAGYMVALGADYILASEGSLTGSIGVILHSAEVLELAEKLGVDITILKSGPYKATPSPFEELTPQGKVVLQRVINDFYNVFVDMVANNRGLDRDDVVTLADGRVYTGRQALEAKLIDGLGNEKQALSWLKEMKSIDLDRVKDVDLTKKPSGFDQVFSSLIGKDHILPKTLSLQGLLSIWLDGIM